MGLVFQISTNHPGGLPNFVAPPIAGGCIGYFEFGASEATSLKNLYNPALPLAKVGNPIFSAAGVQVDPDDYLIGPADSATFTRILVAQAVSPVNGPPTGSHYYVGNFVSGSGGAALYNAASAGAWRLFGVGSAETPNVAEGAIENLTVMSHRMGASAQQVVNHTRSLSQSRSISAYTPPSPARAVRFGLAGGTGAVRILRALLYNVALSDPDLTTAANWLRDRALLVPGTVLGP